MRQFGERLAASVSHMDEVRFQWVNDISSVTWQRVLRWRPVIVIVSYLLASPTLDAVTLVDQLNYLLEKFGRGHVTLLYTKLNAGSCQSSFSRIQRSAASYWL